MAKYKPDQGSYARTTSMLLLGSMGVFGCYTLYYFLVGRKWFRAGDDGPGFFARDLGDGNLPVLGLPLTPALVVAVALGVATLWGLARLLNRPKVADMLIDSETEMRKCTWPSWRETVTSSIVILVVMLFFTAILAGMDFVLNQVMTRYVF